MIVFNITTDNSSHPKPDIGEQLSASLGYAPDITFTSNRRTILSVKRRSGRCVVRMHRCFASAPCDVVEAIARFLVDRSRKNIKIIDAYFERNVSASTLQVRIVNRRVNPKGDHFDLSEIFADLNKRYFDSKVEADITWGRKRVVRGRLFKRSKHITLGSYRRRERLITIHPNLDQAIVPRYMVESIVFHEMCHQVVGGEVVNGRRRLHHRPFKEVEATFPDIEKARGWAKENMKLLLK